MGSGKSLSVAVLKPTEEAKRGLYLDEDVHFTVYHHRTVQPEKWCPLVAFAHLSEHRPDEPPDERDAMAEIQRPARHLLEMMGQELQPAYKSSSQESGSAVPRSGEIIFRPFIKGVEFNPSSRNFRWEESVHREEFKMRGSSTLDGQTARGLLRVYLGPLILAQLNLSFKVASKYVSAVEAQLTPAGSARPLRKVFASYSHKDKEIVEQIEEIALHAHLDIEYLRDATYLRAGRVWSPSLMEMIEAADLFQLFWSTNSMYSPFVRQEYEYALSLRRPHFVLPVYWETPFPEKPQENLPPEELRRLHFENLAGVISLPGRQRRSHTLPTSNENMPG